MHIQMENKDYITCLTNTVYWVTLIGCVIAIILVPPYWYVPVVVIIGVPFISFACLCCLKLICPDQETQPKNTSRQRSPQASQCNTSSADSTAVNIEAPSSQVVQQAPPVKQKEQAKTQEENKPEIAIISSSSYISNECTICYERQRNVALVQCGHLTCTECARALMSSRECPFCRAHISHYMNIVT